MASAFVGEQAKLRQRVAEAAAAEGEQELPAGSPGFDDPHLVGSGHPGVDRDVLHLSGKRRIIHLVECRADDNGALPVAQDVQVAGDRGGGVGVVAGAAGSGIDSRVRSELTSYDTAGRVQKMWLFDRVPDRRPSAAAVRRSGLVR
jgi:hypothetical protein